MLILLPTFCHVKRMYTWVSNGESNNPPLCPFPPWFPSGSLHTLHYGADVPKSAPPHWPRLCWGEGPWQHPLSHAASSQVGKPLVTLLTEGNLSSSCRPAVSCYSAVCRSPPPLHFNHMKLCKHMGVTNKSPASTTLLQILLLQQKMWAWQQFPILGWHH